MTIQFKDERTRLKLKPCFNLDSSFDECETDTGYPDFVIAQLEEDIKNNIEQINAKTEQLEIT